MEITHILAIDPSGNFEEGKGTTGIVLGGTTKTNEDLENLSFKAIKAKDYDTRIAYWEAILLRIKSVYWSFPKMMVVIENYQVRNNAINIGKTPETILLLGYLIGNLEKEKIPYKLQTASQVKGRYADHILLKEIPLMDKKVKYIYKGHPLSDHLRDALRHYMYFRNFGGI